jgi:hypothetical protein
VASVRHRFTVMTSCCRRLRSSGRQGHCPPGGRALLASWSEDRIQKNRNRGRQLVTEQLASR